MGNKVGRKNVYDTKIKPYFSEILEMCRTSTDRQIAEVLGVAYSSFMKYKSEKEEFSELLKNGRQNLVAELKGALIKKAKGFTYEEKKVIADSDGVIRKEIMHKYSPPDVAAINLLLKNYDKDNWSNDPQILRLKEKEIELKQKAVEENNDYIVKLDEVLDKIEGGF